MDPLPTTDLRANLGTWAVRLTRLPAVARWMLETLPPEAYDPDFLGQRLETTYFDTRHLALRKARKRRSEYLTLRIRRYRSPDQSVTYALSAKTETRKFRLELSPLAAQHYIAQGSVEQNLLHELPADLLARALHLAGEEEVLPVVTLRCRRYAIEDEQNRFTLDTGVHTDLGRVLPYGVLEFKSTDLLESPPGGPLSLGLPPIKLSKFLWATEP